MNNINKPSTLDAKQKDRLRQKLTTVLAPIYYKELLKRAPEDGREETISTISESSLYAVEHFTTMVDELFEKTFDSVCDVFQERCCDV